MKPAIIPSNLTGKSLFEFLVKNESLIIHSKKSEIKRSDNITFSTFFIDEKGELVSKANVVETQVNPNQIKAVVVINTTNWYDSHGDVHIPGIWKKSLSDNKKNGFYLLDNHNRGFEDVIADECKAEAKPMAWKDLGIPVSGTTEALTFTAIIDKDRNPKMFDQYYKKYVKQHSVGMRYIKMVTCINDDDYPVQKENWDKYFPMVANQADCKEDGYFWAVLEAQIIEGSAVLFGSNCMTPTINVTDTDDQPLDSTGKHQPSSTDNKSMVICPSCTTHFNATSNSNINCPNCGQYVSPQSSSIETDTFDLIAAIAGTTFI